MAETEIQRTYKLVAYGCDEAGLSENIQPITARNFTLDFEKFRTQKRLDEYEGVIVFQGIFEFFENRQGFAHHNYVKHTFDRNELDKRIKEVNLLREKGGFICFILTKPFNDRVEEKDCSMTDLTKYYLGFRNLYRDNYNSRAKDLQIARDEFRDFLRIYGASWSYFKIYNDALDVKVIAKFGMHTVSMILEENLFFVPSLKPDNSSEKLAEYFGLLCTALTSSLNKIRTEIPDWVDQYRFEKEKILIHENEENLKKIEIANRQIEQFRHFKSILHESGDNLLSSVVEVMNKGFEFKVVQKDEFKEDIQIVSESNEPLLLVEVKGTNSGIKNENINQTDTHRERNGFKQSFPAILIINTVIKNARTLAEKDHPVGEEQIKHAVRNGVLILRTLDLLQLLKMHLEGKIGKEEVLKLLLENKGWLRVTPEKLEVLVGN